MKSSNVQVECIQKICTGELELVSLKDVPVEVRRQEAEKPLYIVRYE